MPRTAGILPPAIHVLAILVIVWQVMDMAAMVSGNRLSMNTSLDLISVSFQGIQGFYSSK